MYQCSSASIEATKLFLTDAAQHYADGLTIAMTL